MKGPRWYVCILEIPVGNNRGNMACLDLGIGYRPVLDPLVARPPTYHTVPESSISTRPAIPSAPSDLLIS